MIQFDQLISQLSFIKNFGQALNGGELKLPDIDKLLGAVSENIEACFNHCSIIRGMAIKARNERYIYIYIYIFLVCFCVFLSIV